MNYREAKQTVINIELEEIFQHITTMQRFSYTLN
jgi:hypothetical protein